MITPRTLRLHPGDEELARRLFAMMAEVFEEPHDRLDDEYLTALLRRADFWAIAAVAGDQVVGGLTAHTLPMTRRACGELFIYDLAVRADWQRQGVGRQVVAATRDLAARAGVADVFVPAETEDVHALDFYRALGGEPTPVVMFTFSGPTK